MRKKKVDTPFEYKETPLAANGITVYYDATLSKLSYAKTENVKGTGDGIPHSEKVQFTSMLQRILVLHLIQEKWK